MTDILNTEVRIHNLSLDYVDGTTNLEIRLYEKEKVIQLGFDPDNITPIEIDFFGIRYTGKIHIKPGKPERPLTVAYLSPIVYASDGKKTKIPYLLSDRGIKAKERIPARLTLTKLVIGSSSSEEEIIKRSVIVVNISWNPYHWQKPYTDPRAGHSYARKYPGHESVNFHFNKIGIDNENYVYGYSQWQHYPKEFLNGGYVLFYTKNLETNKSQIVGVYGDVEILNPPQKFHYDKFENNILQCNMKATKALSMLLPLPLDAKKYSSGRMVGQIGFTYYDENIVQKVIFDEYELLKQAGGFPDTSYAVLNRIYARLTGNHLAKKIDFDAEQSDLDEQNELEKSESQKDMTKLLDDLKNVKTTDSEQVEVHGKVYKRDNKTIAQLKIVRGHKCQICGLTIKKKDGSLYIEAAHITPKKQKGTELPNNIILLCPNHHKEFDLGKKEILKRDGEVLVVMLNESKYSIDLRL